MTQTFLIEIRERKGEVRVRASDGDAGKASAEPAPQLRETASKLDDTLHRLELLGRPAHQFQLPAAAAAQAGLALAAALPEGVTRRLAAALRRRPAARLDVVFDLGGPGSPRWLHAVPWELLRLPDDEFPVALHEYVALYRRVPADGGLPPRGGLPLRVLYAVAAPDALAADVRSSLDWEREEELIFDAVRATVPDAVFETADEGNLAYLEEVVESLRPHVVHLSGHGRRGALLLEDELGFEREVELDEFKTFLAKLPDATRLVVLAQCLSAADVEEVGEESPFAHFTAVAASERGYGLGMQFPVDDLAASWWAAGFYESLAEGRFAELSRAVAAGRRRVFRENEARRQRAANSREFDRSDWSAPVLYVAGEVFRLLEERDDGEARLKPSPPSLADVKPYRDRRAFVGRRRERRRLLRAVRREHCVGVVLRALGGTGKSTLAAHLIERLAALDEWRWVYFSGRLEVPEVARKLAEDLVEDPGELSSARRRAIRDEARELAAAVGRGASAQELIDGTADLLQRVWKSGLRLLLVFDDFEKNQLDGKTVPEDPLAPSLVDPRVADLLERLAAVACKHGANTALLLFASRYKVVVPLPSGQEARWLDVPVGPLGAGEQRKLWDRLASRPVTTERRAAVWERLGGHPRSLEILAWMEAGDAGRKQELAERLGEAVPTAVPEAGEDLVAASAELAAENADLGALLAQLEPFERAVLAGLARFRRPFAESACPAVVRALAESDLGVALRIWQRLLAFGLVAPARSDVRRAGGDVGEALWHVPHLVRGELTELREPQPEVDAAAARHLRLRLESEALGLLERLDLYEAIVQHGVDGQEWGLAGDAALAVLTPLTHLGEWRRARDLGDSWLARTRIAFDTLPKVLFEASVAFRLAALHRFLGEPETARKLLGQALKDLRRFQELPADDEEIRQIGLGLSRVTYELAVLDENQGRYQKARAHLQESLEFDKELSDLSGYSASLNLLAILDIRECRYEEAQAHLQEALQIQMELGDMKSYAASLHQLAIVDENLGRYEEARAHFQESLDLKEKIGDVQGYAASLHQLAILDWHEGLYEEGRVRLQEALDLKKRIGDLKGYAASLYHIAILDENQGRYAEARGRLQQSLQVLKNLDSQQGYSASLHQLGILDSKQGRYDEARAHFQESLDLDRKLGNPQGVAASLHHLAILARNESRYEEARSYLQDSLDILQSLRDPQGYSKSLHELGSTELATGNIDEAERLWRASIEIKERLGDAVGVAMTKLGLGQVRLLDNPGEALGMLEDAVGVLRAKGRDELKQAEAILQQAVELLLPHIGTTLAKAKDDATRAVAHYWRGICYRLLGDEAAARKELQLSLKLNRRLAQPAAVRAVRAQLARLNREATHGSLSEESE